MAYTRDYSVTSPPGTEQAKNIDDRMRDFRLDVKERLDSILKPWTEEEEEGDPGELIDRDPLVLDDIYTGFKEAKKLNIAFAAFSASSIGKEYYYDDDKLIAFTDTDVLVAPLILPIGVVVTKVELLANRFDASNITWKVKWRPFGAGTTATLETVVHSTSGLSVSETTIDPLISGVNEDNIYWLALEGSGSAGKSFYVYGARVTYDTPDSRSTI